MTITLTIHVKPSAKHAGVTQVSENEYAVAVHEPAAEGRANVAAIKAIAKYLRVAPSSITLIRGAKGRVKVLRID